MTDHSTASAPTSSAADLDPWRLRRTGREPARARRDETLFALANGSLGVRGGLEEADGGSDGSFLAAVYEQHPIHYHERFTGFPRHTDTRLPVADGQRIAVFAGAERLLPVATEDFERELDLRQGRLSRRSVLRTAHGARIDIRAERVLPFDSGVPGVDLLAIRYRATSFDYTGALSLSSAIECGHEAAEQGDDPRIGVASAEGLQLLARQADERGAHVVQATRRSGVRVVCSQRHRLEGLRFAADDLGEERVAQRYDAHLRPGESVVLEKFVAYVTDRNPHATDLPDSAAQALQRAQLEGFDAIAARQAQALARFWDGAELSIAGDPASEQALRFNLFHLLQSAGRNGIDGTAAKGLTGEGYEGHYFWDTEAFMLPVMAYTAPEVARAMLHARFLALEPARKHAREMNHARGALFPWRTITGGECSAHYPSGSAAYHINAAVAYGIGLYLDASGDSDFLADFGAEMLFETARIWPQVGHFNPRRGGAFCIHDVTGPDEYTALVDNNFYTNRMAQQHLRRAVAAWEQLERERPQRLRELAERLQLDPHEVATWRRAAETMFLHYDEALGIYAQDDTFLDKPRWPFPAREGEHRPLLLDYHPLTLYRYQVCKQADVVMGLVLAGDGIPVEVKRRSYDYYAAVTTHDSTLSASVFGILASEVGHAPQAERFFHDNLRVDLDDLHGNTDHGVHMAALAGTWLGLASGFAGLRAVDGVLHFAPTLPQRWDGFGFGLRWQGRRLRIDVRRDGVEYSLLDGAPLTVAHAGQRVELSQGAPLRRPLAAPEVDARERFPRPARALIFDLDGVLTDTAQTHYRAWKRMADEEGFPFDQHVNEQLKGVDRMSSLEIILRHAGRSLSAEQKHALAERKNGYYVEAIAQVTPADLFPGVTRVLEQARARGLKLGVASASRNAAALLDRLGIAERFDYIADAARVARAKPAPDIFLDVAAALGVAPAQCIGLEDAAAGVAAIKSAGMAAVGIGDARTLAQADACLPDIAAFDVNAFVSP
ncbi:beta-phosphoglucomutase [Lysobacter sp. K5869]|uniref:beta-phosphoglucomutase n=1 Tax=Lysobacter sp. K5869 TaxID=2820808 RepID=UPI001C063811|nr:beta-phosphoglucomutase [Lysobacter sp. K5869]QWP75144.1 beta-phosphoglucomutase [Lysobacter sp. K5869]